MQKKSTSIAKAKSEAARLLGASSAEKAGKARWQGVSADDRERLCRAAVQVRWAKYKAKKAAEKRALDK